MLPSVRVVLLSSIRCSAFAVTLAALMSGCGGGGGSDNDNDNNGSVRFSGTVSVPEVTTVARGVPDLDICALDVCTTTGSDGEWAMNVPGSRYDGGSVLFSFEGNRLSTSTAVDGLSPDASAVDIDFVVQTDGTVRTVSVAQDAPLPVPSSTPNPTPTAPPDDGPLSTDPEERACQLIERSNISIPNFVGSIVQGDVASCPIEVRTLVAVGNIHQTGFDYEVTVEPADAFTIDPATGRANQGQLNRHDAEYLCNQSASFIATVTARITQYYPADGSAPVSAADALALCGSRSAVGNTSESVQVNVTVP